ncbi:MAG: DUF4832 domain-containing protein [Bacteroidota bacterium]|nr:DUF4832 domain-containing protein [Bacteroidota bacterium]
MKKHPCILIFSLGLLLLLVPFQSVIAQIEDDVLVIRPQEIDDVLSNPGMGFMTFQRFNGDLLNEGSGWTEGFPIDYQEFNGGLSNQNHPTTTIAYWRVYWKFMESEKGVYRWDMLDRVLDSARSRGQTLILRIAPYGTGEERDVPQWYREMVGDEKEWAYSNPVNKWMVDPEDPRYALYFGGFIRALGLRYDGHPDLEAVDLSIVGAWGEGAGSELLSQPTREALVDSYTDSFKKTPLIALLMDKKTNMYARSQIPVGWRVDCIGDLGFWAEDQNGWTHMYDFYPQEIINCGVQDDWLRSPLSFEICGTFLRWRDREGYDREDVKYIIDQTLKWHMSSFNAKSSPVPEEWEDLIEEWLISMGYRFVLRRFSYPRQIQSGGRLAFLSWWENKGVAPCYKDFTLALRLISDKDSIVLPTDAIIKEWLPGDNIYDHSLVVPGHVPADRYELQIAVVDRLKYEPRVNLAIEGRQEDGWYPLGPIELVR